MEGKRDSKREMEGGRYSSGVMAGSLTSIRAPR